MNFVEPIRSTKKIAQIKNQLKGQNRIRDLFLFTVGINTALRVSDLLALQIGDLLDEDGQVKDRFTVKEQKTSKRREVTINDSIREALMLYRSAYPQVEASGENFCFFNSRTKDLTRSINRKQAWKFITGICKEVGLRGHYGTHSLRKTWGYQARMHGVDLALIMHQFNHANMKDTLRYLGITDAELHDVVKGLNL